jgi:hypothetical protein
VLTVGRVALLAFSAGAGAQSITLPHIADTDTLNAPTVAPGAVTITLPHITDTDTLNAPTITTGVTVVLPHLTDTDTLNAPTITVGAVTVTLPHITDTDTLNAPTVVGATDRITVSGRRLMKGADVFHMKSMSLWALTVNLSDADITSVLETIDGLGFNCATFAMCGMDFNGAEGWNQYTNGASGLGFFTGSPITSTLGPAWDHVTHTLDELLRLDMYALLSLYTGFNNTDGLGAELIAAGTSAAFTFGQRVGALLAGYDNIILHYGADHNFNWGSDPSEVVDAWFEGFFDGAGRDDFVIVAEPAESQTTFDQFIDQADPGVGSSGYGWMIPHVNSVYSHTASQVERFEAGWSESGATSYPVWHCEPGYVDSGRAGASDVQEFREQIYAEALEGGCGINWGHEGICGLGGDTGFVDDPDYEARLGDVEVLETAHGWAIVDEWCLDSTFGPDATWVTTGEGSGDNKAALGKSDSVLIGYFPTNRTTTIDTTVFTGSGQVRLRWYDPTAGTYSSIATEAQQTGRSITFPSNHGDGFGDWVLVVDAADVQTVELPHLTDTDTLNAPTVAPGAVTITLPHLTDADTLNAPTVTVGAVTVVLPHLTDTDVLNAPTVTGQGVVALPHIDDTDTLNAPTVTPGAVTVTLPHLTDADTLNAPTITTGTTVVPPHLTNTSVLNAPTVTVTAVTIVLPHITSATVLTPPSFLSNLWALEAPAMSSRVPGVIYSAPTRTMGGN